MKTTLLFFILAFLSPNLEAKNIYDVPVCKDYFKWILECSKYEKGLDDLDRVVIEAYQKEIEEIQTEEIKSNMEKKLIKNCKKQWEKAKKQKAFKACPLNQ